MGPDTAERIVTAEEVDAQVLAADLAGQCWADRLTAVRSDPRHHTYGFVATALDLARDSTLTWGCQQDWAQLAVEASRRSTCSRVRELEALSWAVLGNCRRRVGEMLRARAAFCRCRATRSGIADPVDLAETYSLEASYCCDVRDHVRAHALIDAALVEAGPYATESVLSRYAIKKAMVCNESGHHAEALGRLIAALPTLDAAADPLLYLVATHNVATALLGVGDPEGAMLAILGAGDLWERYASPKLQLERDWLIARIAAHRGSPAESRVRLERVRDGFLAADLPYAAAVLELEIADASAALGDWASAEASSATAAAVLEVSGSPRETLAAVLLLVEGARRRRAPAVLQELARRARHLVRHG